MDSPATPVQTGNPKDMYRAYPLTAADRASLLKQFPPRFSRVIADHISAEGLRSMDKVREGAATGRVIGVANGDKYQALVVTINGRELTSDGTPFHVSWSVDASFSSGAIGSAIARDGFKRLAEPIVIDLSAGPAIRSPLRRHFVCS
ncbi:MAG: hypothetical protein WCJ87_06970 [Burkholderiales bacterium]